MNGRFRRRRSPPVMVWFMIGLTIVAALACAALSMLAWQEAAQIQALQAEVEALRNERQETGAQLAALRSTATVMQDRLATLEANDPAQQIAALQASLETPDDSQQISDLRATLTRIQSRIDDFQGTLYDLAARIDAMEAQDSTSGESLPPEIHLEVALQRQSHNLSCESSAASMVAQFYGVDLSEAEVLAALPLNENPHLGFRGNVDGLTGGIVDYGVYAGPILSILNARGLRAWPVEGGISGIKAALARGNPVIAWVTYDCLPSIPTTEIIDGKAVTLVPNQHVIVVTGYNSDGVWANDPWDGKEEFYPTAALVRAMGYFGDMALEVAAP